MRLHRIARLIAFSFLFAACSDEPLSIESPAEPEELFFPEGFLLGTATAAHQVEGNIENDMQRWEDVKPDKDGNCKIRNCDKTTGDTPASGWATGKYVEDFERAKSLGHNTLRVGFEWGKLFPAPGEVSDVAVKHYHDMLAEMKANGLKPMVTVNHFTLPAWIHDIDADGKVVGDKKGWLRPDIAEKMGEFAAFLATEYGAEVDLWCTINEPWSVLLGGFLAGVLPPGKFADFDSTLVAFENMLRAHAAIYNAIKEHDKHDADGDGENALVGIVRHDRKPVPFNPDNPKDVTSAEKTNYVMTDLFNNAIITGVADLDFDGVPETEIPGLKGTTDYWGVNYYGIIPMDSGLSLPYVGGIPEMDATKLPYEVPVNDLRWAIDPEGFRERLNYYWKKWGKVDGKVRPLIVTENGVADAQDLIRPKFLVDHLRQLLLALHVDGVDVRGYYHWTLVDNFEWAEGYAAWFGLYQMNPLTQERKETEGARTYRAIAEANGITKEIQQKWGEGEYATALLLDQNYFAPPSVGAR